MSSSEPQSRAAYEAWHEAVYAEDATADRPWHSLVLRHLRPADLDGRHVLEIGADAASWPVCWRAGCARLVAADFARVVRFGAARGRHRSLGSISWMVVDVRCRPARLVRHRDLRL
jgi:hypothetical protein